MHKLFQSRGKIKALQAMLKHDSVETFRLLEQEWEVLQELFDKLQVIFFFFLHGYLIPGILWDKINGNKVTIKEMSVDSSS